MKILVTYSQKYRAWRQLGAQLEAMKPRVVAELRKLPDERFPTPYGLLLLRLDTVWRYSQAVKDALASVGVLQFWERKEKIAKPKKAKHVVFIERK